MHYVDHDAGAGSGDRRHVRSRKHRRCLYGGRWRIANSCAQDELVQMFRDTSDIDFTLSPMPSDALGCVNESLPFTMMLPLNVNDILVNIVNLTEGLLRVDINDVTLSFDPKTIPVNY